MKKNELSYAVSDLGQATALVCSGYVVVDLAPNPDSDRVTFYFKPDDRISNVAQSYWAGTLQVDARQFWQEMKNLKTRLYSLR